MKMGSSLWRWKHSVRRNPWLLLAPVLVLGVVVLVIMIKLLKWASLMSSAFLWLLLGVALGLWVGSLVFSRPTRGKGKKWKGMR